MTDSGESAAAHYVQCERCGHRHEMIEIPQRCPRCGSAGGARKGAAGAAPADTQQERFRLAAEKAKGNF